MRWCEVLVLESGEERRVGCIREWRGEWSGLYYRVERGMK